MPVTIIVAVTVPSADQIQHGVGVESRQDHLRQAHPQERERADQPRPVHQLLDGEEALVRAETGTVDALAVQGDVRRHGRVPVAVRDRDGHQPPGLHRARVEQRRAFGGRVEREQGRARQRCVFVVDELAAAGMGDVDQPAGHAGRVPGRGSLRGRRAGIDRNSGRAEPLDGQRRLDRGDAVAEPDADTPSGEVTFGQRTGEPVDAVDEFGSSARAARAVTYDDLRAGSEQSRPGRVHADISTSRSRSTARCTFAPPSTHGSSSTTTISGTSCGASPGSDVARISARRVSVSA